MHSERLDDLALVSEALCALMFPFSWQYVYIPILPAQLLDCLSAPMPLLIGIHTRYVYHVEKNIRIRHKSDVWNSNSSVFLEFEMFCFLEFEMF